MKRRLSALLLAAGLAVSALSMGVYAEETETEAAQQVTEAAAEAALEEEESELESEVAAEGETEAAAVSQEDAIKGILESQLQQISAWTDDQIEMLIASDDMTSVAIATNWKSVKEELGAFVEVTDAQLNAEGTEITGHAKYEKINENTDVVVTYSVNAETQTASMTWDIDYPMGILMQRAAMNTVMGIGIVFLTLLFLSFLIAQMHIIPDMVEKMGKKKAPAAPAPAPAPAPAAAPAPVAEEDLTDDLELVAVITAAIAASENTSSDGFVVRSIKKANKRNWQRA